jgi:filamentous hemagglutinin
MFEAGFNLAYEGAMIILGGRASEPNVPKPPNEPAPPGDTVPPEAPPEGTTPPEKPAPGGGWKPGDDIYGPTQRGTPPSDRTIGRRFWKNEAENPSRPDYSPEDLERMERGEPPQRYNDDKGGIESMERSHEPVPKSEGGKDMVPRWPQEHAEVDPNRYPGY